jgi:hypothetical protein
MFVYPKVISEPSVLHRNSKDAIQTLLSNFGQVYCFEKLSWEGGDEYKGGRLMHWTGSLVSLLPTNIYNNFTTYPP